MMVACIYMHLYFSYLNVMIIIFCIVFFFFSSRRRHTRCLNDWSSDVCSSDLKGYRRRVGLAQAILHDPEVLILDEPTDGLDPNQKHEVRELIGRMAKSKIIVISTHLLEEVEAVCNRAIIIARGKILADDTPRGQIGRAT